MEDECKVIYIVRKKKKKRNKLPEEAKEKNNERSEEEKKNVVFFVSSRTNKEVVHQEQIERENYIEKMEAMYTNRDGLISSKLEI